VRRGRRCAAQDWIVTNGLAYHFERGHNYNWLTAGVGFEKTVSRKNPRGGRVLPELEPGLELVLAAAWLPLAKDALAGSFWPV
jgi:hypothetical protein